MGRKLILSAIPVGSTILVDYPSKETPEQPLAPRRRFIRVEGHGTNKRTGAPYVRVWDYDVFQPRTFTPMNATNIEIL